MPDYSVIDQPPVLKLVFYPRKYYTACPENAFDLVVPVDPDASISCRFYAKDINLPWILYFHGNGEVVSDYDEIATFYNKLGLNLVVADYRGYGASTGSPTFTNLIKDAKTLFTAVKNELSLKGFQQNVWIMGRSLGSISALELAYHHPDKIMGMIIESGFACVVRIMKHLGHLPGEGNLPRLVQECLDMVSKIYTPALIIHGREDDIVPIGEAKDLFEHMGTTRKKLVIIPDAGHNDILFAGFKQYFGAIRKFIANHLDNL
ncbi:MAG: 2-succinyl-6-hydroxy-2,4-cyclohexadiene-1-carboxylate synthase [Pelotomaculum sp. PtaU1.Bin035]|nr:MAG: 2-succinyl-6-hydroxy-2,4-cyclohexadiene-1-carboxylate synthase [Pelotomaculum sp. PtaU1.Bin035]